MAQVSQKTLLCKGHKSPILNCTGLKVYDDDNKKSMFYVNTRSQFAWYPDIAKDKQGKQKGLIPYCKDCVQKMFEYYYENSKNFQLAVYYTCQKLDIPFILELFESIFKDYKEKSAKEFADLNKKYMGEYIRLLNQGSQKYGDKLDFSYSDSDLSNIDTKMAEREKSKQELDNLRLDWGNQEDNDYSLLEYDFASLTDNMALTKPQEKLYRDLCLAYLAKRKAEQVKDVVTKEKNEDVQKIQKQILELMKTLKIDNFAENKELSAIDRMLETRIAIQEKEKPCFYYEGLKAKQNDDFLGRGKYFYDHIYRPFKNIIGNNKLYNIVPEEEDELTTEEYEDIMDSGQERKEV